MAEVLHRLPGTLEARSSVNDHRVLMDVLPDNRHPTPWKQGSHDLHGHFATVLSCETLRSSVCSRPSFDHIRSTRARDAVVGRLVVHQASPDGISGARSTVLAVAWVAEGAASHGLIIRLIIQTIRRDPSGAVWTDGAPNVSRPDPTGADQIDAEHQATDLAVGGSNPSRRAKRAVQRPSSRRSSPGRQLGSVSPLTAFDPCGCGHPS